MTPNKIIRILQLTIFSGIALTIWVLLFNPELEVNESGKDTESDIYVRTFTAELTKHCGESLECKAYTLFEYVKNSGESEESRAELLASYFRGVGIESSIISSPSGGYTLGCGLDPDKLRHYVKAGEELIMEDEALIAGGQLWVAIPDIAEAKEYYDIKINASSRVQLYVFPSGTEIDFSRELYIKECTVYNQADILQRCGMYKGNAIVVYASEGNTRLNMRLTKYAGEIGTSIYRNKKCVQFFQWGLQ